MGLIRIIHDQTHYLFVDECGIRKPYVIEMDLYNEIIMHFLEKVFGKEMKDKLINGETK